MLMAVALISVVAVAASPAFVRLMRDRRVNRQAMWIVNYMRTARLRAVGRGLPVVVQINSTAPSCLFTPNAAAATGTIRMLESELSTLTVGKPTCNTQNWSNAAVSEATANTTGSVYETPGFCTSMTDGNYAVSFFDDTAPTPNAQGFGEICYSSSGRAYVRYNQGVAFSKLVGVPSFQIANVNYGPMGFTPPPRVVYVPPNSPARMAL
jgi:Tfp pilus assembly protein FimT